MMPDQTELKQHIGICDRAYFGPQDIHSNANEETISRSEIVDSPFIPWQAKKQEAEDKSE